MLSRKLQYFPLWLIALLAVASGTAGRSSTLGPIVLELPDFGGDRLSPGILRIPEPEKIRRIAIHIPRPRIQRGVLKLNTNSMGPVQMVRVRQDEVIYEIDLARNEARSYELVPADNTIEITVYPEPGAEPVYASWVIAPPKDHQEWIARDTPNRSAASGGDGLKIFEQFDDGHFAPLENGVTSALRVRLEARLAKSEESRSMKILWSAPGKDPETISVGEDESGGGGRGAKPVARKPSALSATIDLEIGKNRLEAEVRDGYNLLHRTVYTVLRRAPTEPTAVAGNKWAVILGISDYQDNRLDLQFAHRDAQALRDLLVEKGGFSTDRVMLLTNAQATLEGARTALFEFLKRPGPDDLVLVFLAGHGVQDPSDRDNYFFLAHDSKLDNLGGTALPTWDLGSLMDFTIRAKRIIILADTCHSGAVLEKGNAAPGATLNFFNKYLENLARRKGRLILTASQSHESSIETPRLGHGVFTHALLQGLGGRADDNPSDGVVTAAELIDFIRTEVPRETGGEQHPSFAEEGFDMHLPITHVRRESQTKR